jgi:hypothetical protein
MHLYVILNPYTHQKIVDKVFNSFIEALDYTIKNNIKTYTITSV